jgi:hypothetical protein
MFSPRKLAMPLITDKFSSSKLKAAQPFARVCENSAASQCGAGFTLPRWQLGPPFQVAYPLTPLPVLAVSLLL